MNVLNIIKNNLFQTAGLIIKYLKKFTLMKIVISQPYRNQNTSEAVKSLENLIYWTPFGQQYLFHLA